MSNSSSSTGAAQSGPGTPNQQQPAGGAGTPPYPPRTAPLGLAPSILPDVPVCAVLLALFLVAAAAHAAIFRRNRRRRQPGGRKFLFSVLLVAFCAARCVALALRCAWAAHPRNVRVALAAQILTAAGVLILFIVNLVFALRVVRSYHPFFGWSRPVTGVFGGLFVSAAVVLVAVVTVTVQSFFVRDGAEAKVVDRTVQLVCATYLAVYAFLPVVVVALAVLVPGKWRKDKFGEGRDSTKLALLVFTSSLLALGAGFRAAVAYLPRPLADPAWFHSKPCFYCFNFGVELVVVWTYALSRFDKRFHVPDGSSAPGHYSGSWAEYGRQSGPAAPTGAIAEGGEREQEKEDGGEAAGEMANQALPPTEGTPTRQSDAGSVRSVVPSASSSYSTPRSGSSLVSDEDWPSVTRAMRELFGDDEEAQRLEDAQKPGPLPRIRISRSGDLVRGLERRISSVTWPWLRELEPYDFSEAGPSSSGGGGAGEGPSSSGNGGTSAKSPGSGSSRRSL